MNKYDEIDAYSYAYFHLDYKKNGETITYMYEVDFSDLDSILVEYKIIVNDIVNEKRIYTYNGSETDIEVYNRDDLIKQEREVLSKDEFINKFTCPELSKYNIDLIKATKYYRDYAGGLGDFYWQNYFYFKNYPYHIELFENNWDIKISQIYFAVEKYNANREGIKDYSFDRVIVKGKDAKNKRENYTLVFELKK